MVRKNVIRVVVVVVGDMGNGVGFHALEIFPRFTHKSSRAFYIIVPYGEEIHGGSERRPSLIAEEAVFYISG